MDDLISRQAVKEWLKKWEGYIDQDTIARMQYRVIDIPSAQPEIIRCKECSRWCICHRSDDWYCADAERIKA